MQKPVSREIEGVDLDLGFLAGMHEADVAVRHHRLDFEMAVERHDHGERLRRSHHAPDRVHRELLYDAVDWRGEHL